MGSGAGFSNKQIFYGMLAVFGLCLLVMVLFLFTGEEPPAVKPVPKPAPVSPPDPPEPDLTLPDPDPEPEITIKDEIRKLIAADLKDEARALLSKALEQDPADLELQAWKKELEKPHIEEAAQPDAYAVFIDSAQRAAESGQWSLAVVNYENALKLKDVPELQSMLEEARFSMHRQAAELHIRKERLPEAYREVLKALEIRKDTELDTLRRKLVEDLSRLEKINQKNQAYEQYRAGAETQLVEGDLDNALTLFKLALDSATSPQQKEYISGRIAFCERRQSAEQADQEFNELFRRAEQAYRESQLAEAGPLYRKALTLKPGHVLTAQRLREIEQANLPPSFTDTTGSAMVLVPEGVFRRGSQDSPSADCKPEADIFVSAFYMDAHEVTNKQYEQFDPEHARGSASPGDDMPVTNVSWEQAAAFCAWRTEQNGGTAYRLPTEAEWEKAARAGKAQMFAWGNTYDTTKGWVGLQGKTAVNVSTLAPNALGLYHMSGNVWEWCHDRYAKEYYSAAPLRDPAGPDKGEYRVVRGGSFRFGEKSCRTYERNAEKPGQTAPDIGFRCVRLIPAETRP